MSEWKNTDSRGCRLSAFCLCSADVKERTAGQEQGNQGSKRSDQLRVFHRI